MIDSHTHLDFCEAPNGELVAEALAAGVTKMLTVGTDAASSRDALAAAAEFPSVFAAVGHHPNNATGFSGADRAELLELAADPLCRAVGETGFDRYREGAPLEDQRLAFEAQIQIAAELGKPLIIHTRDADDLSIDTLREQAKGVRVVLHCFTMPTRLQDCLAEGWWISFAGNVTYPKASDLAEAAALVPDDRLLVETDAPYLTPQHRRRERNTPGYVVHTAEFVAQQRGVDYASFDQMIERNAAELFGW
jgi:TatD DNase family protein